MKIIVALALAATLSGCALVDKVKDYWPRDHDAALVSMYINLEREIEAATCGDSVSFVGAINVSDWINRYAEFRNDPQKIATKNVKDNLEKAASASEGACKRYVNLTKINMKLIKDSWSGR